MLITLWRPFLDSDRQSSVGNLADRSTARDGETSET